MTDQIAARPKTLSMPVVWAIGAVLVLAMSAVGPLILLDGGAIGGTFYVIVHAHYFISFAAAFAVFAAIYLIFERALILPYRRPLAFIHFAISLTGSVLIFSPAIGLAILGIANPSIDAKAAFAVCQALTSLGYGVIFIGLLVFLALLADAVRGRLMVGRGRHSSY